jgi:hypothetical protein
MATETITPAQLRTLQTLFGKYVSSSLDASTGDPRAARLEWASQNIARPIGSFKELRADEAARLIDALKVSLGQEIKHIPRRAWRRPRSREAAEAAGRHGRRNHVVEIAMLAGPEDFDKIDDLREAAGMSREQLDLFLRGPKSPTRGGAIRTLADANKLIWALKGMARRRAG